MTGQPHPAPKTQRPIRDDPKVGQYQVVVSFRVKPHPGVSVTDVRDGVTDVLVNDLASTEGHVYVIGAGGERSIHEGTVGL